MNTNDYGKLITRQKKFVESLIGETEQAVAKMLFKMTDDYPLIEDVMIETWTLVCQKVELLTTHENPQGWIMKTAKHRMFKALAKRRRTDEREMLILDKVEICLESEEIGAFELLEALKSYLTEKEREVLLLRYYNDMTYEELAEYYQISEAAIRKRVSRVVQKLRKEALELWNK